MAYRPPNVDEQLWEKAKDAADHLRINRCISEEVLHPDYSTGMFKIAAIIYDCMRKES